MSAVLNTMDYEEAVTLALEESGLNEEKLFVLVVKVNVSVLIENVYLLTFLDKFYFENFEIILAEFAASLMGQGKKFEWHEGGRVSRYLEEKTCVAKGQACESVYDGVDHLACFLNNLDDHLVDTRGAVYMAVDANLLEIFKYCLKNNFLIKDVSFVIESGKLEFIRALIEFGHGYDNNTFYRAAARG